MDEKHHFHLVDWKSICRPVRYGVLGVSLFKDHNQALLAKWLWRFGVERESLWQKVVVARFGFKSVRECKEVRVRHGCGI